MKRFLTLVLLVSAMLYTLPSCCCGGEEADLVFVNDSNAVIVAVLADFTDQGSVVQNADSSPLKRGESFGFQAGEYPATVMVYDKAVENLNEMALTRFIVNSAPPEGERWYVTARDDGSGLTLSVGTQWPEGV